MPNSLFRSPPAVRQRAKELRWPMTPAEARLWERLKTKQLHGLKFRRQHPLSRFIVDFYCHAHSLVIEIDGGIHAAQRERDEERTAWLEGQGLRVIRFTNDQVFEDLEGVLRRIAGACGIAEGNGREPDAPGDVLECQGTPPMGNQASVRL